MLAVLCARLGGEGDEPPAKRVKTEGPLDRLKELLKTPVEDKLVVALKALLKEGVVPDVFMLAAKEGMATHENVANWFIINNAVEKVEDVRLTTMLNARYIEWIVKNPSLFIRAYDEKDPGPFPFDAKKKDFDTKDLPDPDIDCKYCEEHADDNDGDGQYFLHALECNHGDCPEVIVQFDEHDRITTISDPSQ